jgi:hypothetical protein
MRHSGVIGVNRFRVLIAGFLLCVLSGLAYALMNRDEKDAASAQTLWTVRAPFAAEITSLAWVPAASRIVVSTRHGWDVGDSRLFEVNLGNGKWRRIAIPRTHACPIREAFSVSRLSASEVAFVAGCYGNASTAPADTKTVLAYSVTRRTFRKIFTYGIGFAARGVSVLSARPAIGIMNDGYGLGERLRRLDSLQRSAPLKLPVDRVRDPFWSPDGASVAFGAATGLSGASGLERTRAKWSMYLLNPSTGTLREAQAAYDWITRGAWRADSRLFAYAYTTVDGDHGIAIMERGDLSTLNVSSGAFSAVDWHGRCSLIASRTSTPARGRAELVGLRIGDAAAKDGC